MEPIKKEYYQFSEKEIESINEIDKSYPKIENLIFKFGTTSLRYNEKN